MKQVIRWSSLKLAALSFLFVLMQVIAFAQDGGSGGSSSGGSTSTTSSSTTSTVDVTSNSGNWYANPWVWVIGAAVFILLLVALLSGNKGRATSSTTTSTTAADRGDRVTVQKTTRTDTDI